MKKIMALTLVLILLLASVACAQGDTPGTGSAPPASGSASNEVFKIVAYQPLSGGNATFGNAGKEGMDLALKEINAAGGFNGVPGEITYFDTTSSVEEAVKIAQMIIETMDDINVVIASQGSSEVQATIQFLNDAKIYHFGLGTSAAWMTNPDHIWTHRASINNIRTVPGLAKVVSDVLKYDTVAILSSTDEGGTTTTRELERLLVEAGVTVTTYQEADIEATSFPGQITQILNTNPDVIYISGLGTQPALMAQQIRFAGYDGLLLCKDPAAVDMINIGGDAMDYLFSVFPYITYQSLDECDIPFMKAFQERHLAEYGRLPQIEGTYRGYDTMMVIWEASKIAGSNDMEALRVATGKVKMEGLGGMMDYTKGDRESYSEFYAFICIDGKNVLFDNWFNGGGYQEYLARTGRAR